MPQRKIYPARYVGDVEVTDPDTKQPIELEVWKDPITEAIFAVDASYLDKIDSIVSSPFGTHCLELDRDGDDPEPSDYAKARDAVACQTGTRVESWKAVNGPETGVGNEFYFESDNPNLGVWYVCVDQGDVTACQQQGAPDA